MSVAWDQPGVSLVKPARLLIEEMLMNDSPPQPFYASYLLRVWREGSDGAWRASLESVVTGERHYFSDLEKLLVFIQSDGGRLAQGDAKGPAPQGG
jgi:hypothetical protein